MFVWPFLLLAGGLIAGLGLGTGIGWTPAAIVGVVAGLAAGIGAYIGLAKMARPGVVQHAVPLRKAIAEADQLVEQNKDWVKNEFESKLESLDEGPAKKVQRRRGGDGSPRRRVPEPPAKANRRGRQGLPGQARRRSAGSTTRG